MVWQERWRRNCRGRSLIDRQCDSKERKGTQTAVRSEDVVVRGRGLQRLHAVPPGDGGAVT